MPRSRPDLTAALDELLSKESDKDNYGYSPVDYEEEYGGSDDHGDEEGQSLYHKESISRGGYHKAGYPSLSGYGGYGHHHGGGGYEDDHSHPHVGGYGAYNEKKDCCELVVDPLTFALLAAAIVGGTAFLNTLISMNLGRKRRRRRSGGDDPASLLEAAIADSLLEGRALKSLDYFPPFGSLRFEGTRGPHSSLFPCCTRFHQGGKM